MTLQLILRCVQFSFTLNRMAKAPPGHLHPEPPQMQPPLQPQGPPRCSYVDFVPQPLSMGGAFSLRKYPPFSSLLGPANQWLATNPQQEVVTCESCEMKVERKATVDNDRTFFSESSNFSTYYIRILRYVFIKLLTFCALLPYVFNILRHFFRVWFRPRDRSDPPGPTQLGVLNFVPQCVSGSGFLSQPKFATVAETVISMNQFLASNPLPGSHSTSKPLI